MVGRILNDAMLSMKLKNIPGIVGKFTLNNGIKTIICYVFIIDRSCYSEADIIMLSIRFPAIKALDAVVRVAAISANLAAKLPFSIILGNTDFNTVFSFNDSPYFVKKK